jgi:predicted dehydrogenase
MVKVGVVGCGYWGPNLVRNLLDNHEVGQVTICDLDARKLQKIKQRHPSVKVAASFDDLLRDPEIEAVLVATPISTHAELGKKVLQAGKHLFIEKPMATKRAECLELIELADQRSLTLMVGHTFMFSPPVIRIKEEIEQKRLGKIYYISASRVNLGLHQKDVSVIWDLAPHDYSILFYWLDEKPATVSVLGRDYVQKGIPDVAFIHLEFASGIIAHVQLSWLSPSKLRRTTIVGSKKMLVYDDTESLEKVKIFDKGVDYKNPDTFGEYQLSYRAGDIVSPQLQSYEPLSLEMTHFIDCFTKGKKPVTDGQCGLRVVEVLEATENSLKANGQPVKV